MAAINRSPGTVEGGELRLDREELPGAGMILTACTSRILRVRIECPGMQQALSYVGPRSWPKAGTVSVGEGLLSTADCKVEVSATANQLTFSDGHGAFLRAHQLGGPAPDIAQGGGIDARFEIIGDQHFYGLGQGGQQFDRLGGARQLWNSMMGHGPGANIPMPLAVSSRGYAIFFDNSSDGTLVLGRSDGMSQMTYSATRGPLDFYVLVAPDLRGVMKELATLLGAALMPPRWVLGFLQSTRHFRDTDELRELPRKLRDHRIPCDALILLSSYADAKGWNTGVGHLEFQADLWHDPKALLAEMHGMHFHVMSHEYPVLHPEAPQFEEALAKGYLLEQGYPKLDLPRPHANYRQGQKYIDFSHPEVGKWWWGLHHEQRQLGIDGWWLDGGEGPPSESRLHAGDGTRVHNAFDLFRQRIFFEGEATDRPEKRPFLLCRSGGAGMQRYGAGTWSGDVINTFPTLANQVPLALNTGMSGVPYWGSDIGGCYQVVPSSGELFARWFQFGSFCPIFRAHGWIWREHLPWSHGPEVESICRAYAELRYQLLPYTYTLAWQARESGLPLMRPLVLNYPDDPRVWELGDQYLWGDDILVAPVTRDGARDWSVYLPAGGWYDFWTQERYEGPGGVQVAAPLDRMPLFVREGAIVPMGPVMQYSDEIPLEDITLLIYPGPRATQFALYEDDGRTNGYKQGEHVVTEVCVERSGAEFAVTIRPPVGHASVVPAGRTYKAKIRAGHPDAVTFDGYGALPQVAGHAAAGAGWWHDGAHFLYVRFPSLAGTVRVPLNSA